MHDDITIWQALRRTFPTALIGKVYRGRDHMPVITVDNETMSYATACRVSGLI